MTAFTGRSCVAYIRRGYDARLVAIETFEIFPQGFHARIVERVNFVRRTAARAGGFAVGVVHKHIERAVDRLVAAGPCGCRVGGVGGDVVGGISHHQAGVGHLVHVLEVIIESFAETVADTLGDDAPGVTISGTHRVTDIEDVVLFRETGLAELLHADAVGGGTCAARVSDVRDDGIDCAGREAVGAIRPCNVGVVGANIVGGEFGGGQRARHVHAVDDDLDDGVGVGEGRAFHAQIEALVGQEAETFRQADFHRRGGRHVQRERAEQAKKQCFFHRLCLVFVSRFLGV